MARKKFTDEQKAAFLAAVHEYVAKGWSAGSAYKQVAAEYQQEGKEVPEKATFYRWLKPNTANNRTHRTYRTYKENAGTEAEAREAGEAAPEGTAGESPELDDYTHRLEMIVRLYRTRSEAAVDAVCDRLLPELAGEE